MTDTEEMALQEEENIALKSNLPTLLSLQRADARGHGSVSRRVCSGL